MLQDFGALAGRFTVPPFSVLGPQGYWQQRKRLWVKLGIKGRGRQDISAAQNICSPGWNRGKESEFYTANPERCDGHGLSESQERLNAFKSKADPVPGGGPHSVRRLAPKARGAALGRISSRASTCWLGRMWQPRATATRRRKMQGCPEKPAGTWRVCSPRRRGNRTRSQRGRCGPARKQRQAQKRGRYQRVSPVLCGCMYRWYVPQGGKILDPFAGGSTRGIVANYLGYDYTGVEIRQGQIRANVRQAQTAIRRSSGRMAMPTWIHGDSTNLTGSVG